VAQFFEVDPAVLVDVGRRQRRLDAGDLVSFQVQLVQHAVVTLHTQCLRIRSFLFFQISKKNTVTFYVFLNDVSKSRKKSLAKV